MSYKIAAASTDGNKVDVSFGAADTFYIYEVEDDGNYHLIGKRTWAESNQKESEGSCETAGSCGSGSGCGQGNGCGGGNIPKVELVSDCRCILCKKIGFQVRKQLEKKAISCFDIEYEITEVIEKIAFYFNKVDHHQSLRGIRHSP